LETIRRCLLLTGGVRPRPRTRSRRELTVAEREEISRGLAAQRSCRAIAMRIRRAPSSVSREVGRNGGRVGYRASAAEQASLRRHQRPKASKLTLNSQLRAEVEAGLSLDWSPEQISAFLKDRVRPGSQDADIPRDHLRQPVRAKPGGASPGAEPA